MATETAAAEAPTTAEPEVIGVDQVVDLVAPLPDVNKAAIAAENAPQPAAAPDAAPQPEAPKPAASAAGSQQGAGAAAKPSKSRAAPVDVYGRPFDPRLHETNRDGTPVISTSGKRAGKIRCRRQPLREYTQESTIGDQPEATAAEDAPQAAPAQDAEAATLQRKAVATTLAGMQLMLMRMALGPDVATEKEQSDGLTQSWETVVAYYDMRPIHPLVGLMVATGMIVVGSMNKPEARTRLQKLTEWAKVRAYALWLRITGRRYRTPEPAAPAA
jgi:hypothetical protein